MVGRTVMERELFFNGKFGDWERFVILKEMNK